MKVIKNSDMNKIMLINIAILVLYLIDKNNVYILLSILLKRIIFFIYFSVKLVKYVFR